MRLSTLVLAMLVLATVLPAQPADRATILFPFVLDWNDTESGVATDGTYLNAEKAGSHGYIQSKDGHFIEATTGRRIRFFGINLKYDALFPDHEEAETIAAHLAKCGFNLVRIHPNDGLQRKSKQSQPPTLDRSRQDKLDYLISQLNDHGLFVDLVLHSIDDCSSDSLGGRSPSLINGADEFSHELIHEQQQSAAKILSHVNRYTGSTLAGNPALAMVEINNESSLLAAASQESWLHDLSPKLRSELQGLWSRWLKSRPNNSEGAAFPTAKNAAAYAQFQDFLRATEGSYIQDMSNYLRRELKVRSCLLGSQLSSGGPSAVLREAGMDYSDYHSYWQHPRFPGKAWDEHNWLIDDVPLVEGLTGHSGDFLDQICQARIHQKPYSLSEFNEPAPNDFQVEALPIISLAGSFQDWDSICLFEYGPYGRNGQNSKIHSFFDIGDNPAKGAFIPAAASVFRTFAFPAAPNCAFLNVNKSTLERALSFVQLWAPHPKATAFSDRLALALGDGAEPVFGRTEPLEQAKDQSSLKLAQTLRGKMVVAESERLDAVIGFLGGQDLTFQHQCVRISFGHTSNDFGACMLLTLDGEPIEKSKHLLLSIANKTQNTGFKWNKERSTAQEPGTSPTLVEGVPAQIQLLNHNIHVVHALDNRGRRKAMVPFSEDGSFTIGPENETVWFEISDL